jgi:hypothetical protein
MGAGESASEDQAADFARPWPVGLRGFRAEGKDPLPPRWRRFPIFPRLARVATPTPTTSRHLAKRASCGGSRALLWRHRAGDQVAGTLGEVARRSRGNRALGPGEQQSPGAREIFSSQSTAHVFPSRPMQRVGDASSGLHPRFPANLNPAPPLLAKQRARCHPDPQKVAPFPAPQEWMADRREMGRSSRRT